MYSSNNVQFQVDYQSFQTARSLRVTQPIPVTCTYKVLIGLFTSKPSDKLSGNTNISFKRDKGKAIDLKTLEKLRYFFSCHDLPAVCLGGCIVVGLHINLQKFFSLESHCREGLCF